MSVLDRVARDVALTMAINPDGTQGAFDPSSIFVILEIITALLGGFQNCNRGGVKELVKTSHNPSRWDRLAVRSAVRREIGRKEFRRNGKKLVSAILVRAKGLDKDTARELLAAA